MKRSSSLVVLLLILLGTPVTTLAQQTPSRLPVHDKDIDNLLRTDYYGVYMLGKKAGWARLSLTRLHDAKTPGYALRMEMSLKITSAGAKIEVYSLASEEFDAKPPYRFRGGVSSETAGPSVKEIKLTRTDKGFDATIRAGDERTDKQIAALDYTLADVATMYLWIRQKPELGDTITARTFDFDDLKIHPMVYKLMATKKAVASGVKLNYHELEVTSPKEEVSGLVRYDQKGEKLLSMKIGGLVELRIEPESLAKNTVFSGDLFTLGIVKVDKSVGDGSTISSLILETVGKQDLRLKSGPRQAVIRNASGTYTLKLGKAHGIPTKASAQEVADYLAETGAYPISHAKVQALAKEAVGDVKAADEKVKRLVRFVSGYITPSYTTQPLTVMDLLKGRKGDCTQFALLLTTLARAVGVPAREVSGLVLLGDDGKTFGLHTWNELVLDGHWVPVDATVGETEINPIHISFGHGMGDQAVNMLAAYNKLSFRVVEVQHRK